jgi:beta-aspartyl-peptidase (threonine type)
MSALRFLALAVLLVAAGSCGTAPQPAVDWAIAIHGGAGTIDPDSDPVRLQAYRDAMQGVLEQGREMLRAGASALDVCEAVVRTLEDDPLFNSGKGAVFNEQGEHELDASIMDGSTLACGAVAGVRTVRHPITLARHVMTDTRHVLLAGDGAEKFADSLPGLERVDNTFFDTERRRRALERVLGQRQQAAALMSAGLMPADPQPADRRDTYGTVGCVVRDRAGNLAAATSTGGMTAKRWGRVGDTPILGAGNYADGFAAVSCTGTGEEFIRHAIARSVSARMQFAGESLAEATHAVIHDILQPGDGGLIAVDAQGNLAAPFNSTGMYRALADSAGRFEVRIFAD